MELENFLVTQNTHFMALNIFNMPYESISKIIYPKPKYKQFVLAKKSGGYRIIDAPNFHLKDLQRKFLEFLLKKIDKPKACVHGFVQGRSIVSNAEAHCSKKTSFVLNVDLKDFFPSISFYRVRGVFENRPFDFSRSVATVLAHLCCKDGFLAQGAPTSPLISNLICRSLDNQMVALARKYRATYSRYCDDITFSFRGRSSSSLPAGICQFDGENLTVGDELLGVIDFNGFFINEGKSRISSNRRRMEVTGLVVNEFPNVNRNYIDKIRGALHAWRVYGYNAASESWDNSQYKRELRSHAVPRLYMNLRGRLLFLRMVRGGDDEIYGRLASEFNRLLLDAQGVKQIGECKVLPIETSVTSKAGAKNAVFVIHARKFDSEGLIEFEMQGTGFAIEGGCVLSCEHVALPVGAPSALEYVLTVPEGMVDYPLRLIGADKHRDLAVFDFLDKRPPQVRHFQLASADAKQDDSVHLFGFPNWTKGRPLTGIPGVVTSIFPKQGVKRLEASQPIRKGNSGGPLVSVDYKIVGIAIEGAMYDKGNNECVVVSEIYDWLGILLPEKYKKHA